MINTNVRNANQQTFQFHDVANMVGNCMPILGFQCIDGQNFRILVHNTRLYYQESEKIFKCLAALVPRLRGQQTHARALTERP